jgi:transposase InsO family protein
MGPFPHPSMRKAKFVLIFIDDFSCFTWIYFIRKKSKVSQHLKDFKALVETQSGKKIKVLQIDNGGEYVNHEIHNLCHEAGIQLQHTVPYTPQQNEVFERKNRYLKDMAYCMQSHYHKDYGPKNLIVQNTSKTYLPMDLSRIIPPTRLGVALNRECPTFAFLVHVHGLRLPLKRGRHLIHKAPSAFLLDTPTV